MKILWPVLVLCKWIPFILWINEQHASLHAKQEAGFRLNLVKREFGFGKKSLNGLFQ